MISYLGESPGGIFAAIARLGARFSSYLHILFASRTSQQNGTLSLLFGPFSLCLFFFLIFFYTGLSSAFDFSVTKDFSISKEHPHLYLKLRK